jgi:pilus assembly protein Flp/PilA
MAALHTCCMAAIIQNQTYFPSVNNWDSCHETLSLMHLIQRKKGNGLLTNPAVYISAAQPSLKINCTATARRHGGVGSGSPGERRRRSVWFQEHHMYSLIMRFVKDETGATAIEYGLIAAGISVAIIAVVNSLGSQLKSTFTNVSSQLATAGK